MVLSDIKNPKKLKSVYLGIELPETARHKLLHLMPPSFDVVNAHHVTIQFDVTKLSREEIEAWLKADLEIFIRGHAENDRVQAAAVYVARDRVIKAARPDGKHFHI